MTTLDDLKKNTQWSLQSDIQLFDYLQSFSNNLTVKTKTLVDQVEDLSHETAEIDVRLRNTFNEFLMLADTQFIENRVYDDEGGDEEPVRQSEPVVADDPAVIIKESMALGMEALKYFFGEENANQEDMFDDIYNSRPLPFVIGTKLFIESADAGLGDGSYEEEEEPASSAGGVPHDQSQDGEDDGYERESGGGGEHDYAPKAVVPHMPRSHQDSDDDEDNEYNDDNYGRPAAKPVTTMTPYEDDEEDEDYVKPTPAPKAMNKPNASRALYDDEDDDEVNSSYGQKKANVANSLMAQVAARAKQSKPDSDDDRDDEYTDDDVDRAPKRPVSPKVSAVSAGTKQPIAAPAYDEDEDEGDDMFSSTKEDPYSLFGEGGGSKVTANIFYSKI